MLARVARVFDGLCNQDKVWHGVQYMRRPVSRLLMFHCTDKDYMPCLLLCRIAPTYRPIAIPIGNVSGNAKLPKNGEMKIPT